MQCAGVQEFCMAFTPLHRALGIQPSALSYSKSQEAVQQQVTEKGDLDWKRKLPDGRHPKAPEEFAKDVAAMVNAGGGMIVYGIVENGQSSAAEQISTIDEWTDGLERQLRSWAYSLIQPPVHGLEFTPLLHEGSRVIVLQIPQSLETPHFVMKDDSIRAPRRYGAQTVFMSEREIEQAYRTRFDDRRNHERSLSDLLDQVLLGADRNSQVWLAAAARPVTPRPAYAGRVTEYQARELLSDLRTTNPFLKESRGMELAGMSPRPGYRKWRSTYPETGGGPSGIVEIHDDGSVALAYEANEMNYLTDFNKLTDVHVEDAQALSAHIVHLARKTAEMLDVPGDYELSLTLTAPAPGTIYVRIFDLAMRMTGRDWLTPIHQFHTVQGIVAGMGEASDALSVVRSLAVDVMNQGGASNLGHMYLRDKI